MANGEGIENAPIDPDSSATSDWRVTYGSLLELARVGWRFAAEQRPLLLLCVVLFAVAQMLLIIEPFIVGQLINAVQQHAGVQNAENSGLPRLIMLYLLLLLAIRVGFWAFHAPGRLLERNVAFHIKSRYRLHLIKNLIELPLAWHQTHHSGESIDKINKATTALFEFYEQCYELVYMAFRFVGTLAVLIWFMPMAGLMVLIVTAVMIPFTMLTFDRIVKQKFAQLNTLENRTAAAIHDFITNTVTVITLRLEDRVLREISARQSASLALFKQIGTVAETKWFLTTIIMSLTIIFVLSTYTYSSISQSKMLMGGTFFILFEYIRRIGESYQSFIWYYGQALKQAAALQGAHQLEGSFDAFQIEPVRTPLPNSWRNIAIRSLNFDYQNEIDGNESLRDLSIELPRNGKIVLIGESGSGKSTLLSLLRGIRKTEQVEVFCDGQPMPNKLQALSNITTLLQQEAEIFAGTVRFNVTFGMETSPEKIDKVIKLARFDAVLEGMPEGLETVIAEKGLNLSGGERQRLALARGLLFAEDSQIILLDEATSHVDPQNERLIFTGLLDAFRDRCLLAVTHRPNLITLFETVYVFQDGKIIEHGDPAETLEKQGSYLAQLDSPIPIRNE